MNANNKPKDFWYIAKESCNNNDQPSANKALVYFNIYLTESVKALANNVPRSRNDVKLYLNKSGDSADPYFFSLKML